MHVSDVAQTPVTDSQSFNRKIEKIGRDFGGWKGLGDLISRTPQKISFDLLILPVPNFWGRLAAVFARCVSTRSDQPKKIRASALPPSCKFPTPRLAFPAR